MSTSRRCTPSLAMVTSSGLRATEFTFENCPSLPATSNDGGTSRLRNEGSIPREGL